MSAALSNLKTRLANWRQWEANPIVVKELRQAVRSWAVTGMLLLFLAVLFCAAFAFLASQSIDNQQNQELGGDVFRVFLTILTAASLFFIPAYTAVRVAAERQESNIDLLYVSTLTPARIIRGKFFSGAYMAILFFSACMPFMTFTNLLRGIDLPTIFLILLFLFILVCAAIQSAIFLACLPINRLLKIALGLFCGIGMFSAIFPLMYLFFNMIQSGIGAAMGTRNFWEGFLTSIGLVLLGIGLVHVLSIALISPLSANRALPVKTYLTALWTLGGLIAAAWSWKVGQAQPMFAWSTTSYLILCGSLVVIISNSDQLSVRVRKTIPEKSLARAASFLFYNGAAGGLVWAFLLLALTYGATYFAIGVFGTLPAVDFEQFELATPALLLYWFAYALTGLWLNRKFFPRRPPRLAGALMVLLAAVWAIAPNFLYFFMDRLSIQNIERSQPGNIFNVFLVTERHQRMLHLIFAVAWLALMLALNAPWFIRQLRAFKQPQPSDAPPVIGAAPPPIPAPIA
jgi:hypothetical protein